MDTHLLRNQPAYTLDRETAPAMWLVGTLWLIQATGVQTGNRSSFLEQVMPRGLGPPTHRHPLAVEGFYVVEGTVSFHVLGQKLRAEAGTLIHLPRMIPHTFTIETEEARVINFYSPAGAEIHVMCMARAAEERRLPTMDESMPPKSDELNQILSRLYGSVAVTALPFSVPPSEQLLVTRPGVWSVGAVKVASADGAPAFDAFGLRWRLLAAGNDTNETYDLFEVAADAGAGMPARILGGDEALYVLAGMVAIDSDGQLMGGGVGSFSYLPAGALVSWKATSDARVLVFHFPGGFDRALAGGRGDDALAIAWLESMGTRFVRSLPLAPAVLNAPGRSQ